MRAQSCNRLKVSARAFVALCFIVSAKHYMNEILLMYADRVHLTNCNRPLARESSRFEQFLYRTHGNVGNKGKRLFV